MAQGRLRTWEALRAGREWGRGWPVRSVAAARSEAAGKFAGAVQFHLGQLLDAADGVLVVVKGC
jgi:hypothetical protein